MSDSTTTMDMSGVLGAAVDGFGGILWCSVCGNWEWVTKTASFFANGWPKCHTYTMSWITERLIEEEDWVLSADGLDWSRNG